MYQFRQKGNNNFNCGVKGAIASARSELVKVELTDLFSMEAVRKADVSLHKGSKTLATQQKHIKLDLRINLVRT